MELHIYRKKGRKKSLSHASTQDVYYRLTIVIIHHCLSVLKWKTKNMVFGLQKKKLNTCGTVTLLGYIVADMSTKLNFSIALQIYGWVNQKSLCEDEDLPFCS